MAGEDKYRDFMYGEGEKDTVWRFGAPPNYDLVNKLFEEGRTNVWPVGSLEERVQRLVKTWEMELVHKVRPQDYKSINPEKFLFSANARKEMTAQEIREIGGGYNAFLQTDLPKHLRIYDPEEETANSSQEEFTTVFPRGFALEILQVYQGPPTIVYKFRHWSYMDGPFHGHAPTGELVEFFGLGIFHVDDQMRVEKVEFFYERGDFLSSFLKGAPLKNSGGATGSRCPVMKK
ncbi:pathogen-related protein-like [Canna indica]|uniref:Pathogen-related protein-like n=1 Tax=Canna indica TaxID=4628 RepID=A0AAQ3QAK3_9LILI|nr:pathogen-related protein-like [Canna indica]WOL01639.1 pathogen-related protein-like [Canna indica]